MYCSNCGQLLKEGDNFCNNCGIKLVWPTSETVAETEPVSVQTEESAVTAAEEIPVKTVPEEEPAETVAVEPEAPVEETVLQPEPVTEPEAAEPAVEEAVTETPEEMAAAEGSAAEETAPQTESVPEAAEPAAEETAIETAPEEPVPAVEEPVTEEPAAEPVKETPQPAPEKKKKNNLLLYGLIAAAVLIAGIVGYNFLPSTRYNRAIKAADEYMLAADYETAAPEYLKALQIRPQDETASEGGLAALSLVCEDMLFDEKYDEVIALVDQWVPVVSESQLDNVRFLAEEAYGYKVDNLIDAADLDGARTVLQEGSDKGYDMSSGQRSLEKAEKYLQLLEDQKKFLNDMAAKLDSDDFEGALDQFKDHYEEIDYIDAEYGFKEPIIVDVSGKKYKKAGIYEDDGYYAVYYGEYNGDKREGNGIYVIYNDGSYYTYNARNYAVGEWKNDTPNGTVTEYQKIFYNGELRMDIVIKATVSNGLFNGPFEIKLEDETFYGEAADGIIKVLDETDPNGEANKVFMYNSDKSSWYYFTNDASYSKVYGMMGFGEQIY